MSKKFCEQCGAEMGVSAKFCASCGAKVDDVINNDKTATVKVDKAKKDSKNMGFDFSNLNFANILKFGVVGLIIALVFGIQFFKYFFNINLCFKTACPFKQNSLWAKIG